MLKRNLAYLLLSISILQIFIIYLFFNLTIIDIGKLSGPSGDLTSEFDGFSLIEINRSSIYISIQFYSILAFWTIFILVSLVVIFVNYQYGKFSFKNFINIQILSSMIGGISTTTLFLLIKDDLQNEDVDPIELITGLEINSSSLHYNDQIGFIYCSVTIIFLTSLIYQKSNFELKLSQSLFIVLPVIITILGLSSVFVNLLFLTTFGFYQKIIGQIIFFTMLSLYYLYISSEQFSVTGNKILEGNRIYMITSICSILFFTIFAIPELRGPDQYQLPTYLGFGISVAFLSLYYYFSVKNQYRIKIDEAPESKFLLS